MLEKIMPKHELKINRPKMSVPLAFDFFPPCDLYFLLINALITTTHTHHLHSIKHLE